MTRYVALLGSINVGGNRLKMADLCAAFGEDGFENVATVTASGNILFDHAQVAGVRLEERIGSILADHFGIETFAAVRSKAELEASLEENPFAGKGEDRFVHVLFLDHQPAGPAFAKLAGDHEGRGNEALAPGTRALHVDYVDGVGRSKLTTAFIEKRLQCRATARNVRSIRRILERFE